jgi:hypothetical protein
VSGAHLERHVALEVLKGLPYRIFIFKVACLQN